MPNGQDPDPRNPNIPGAGVAAAQTGQVSGNKVRVRAKCPKRATRRCKVTAVGRLGRRGPVVTDRVRQRVRPGGKRVLTLTVNPASLAQARAAGSVTVQRKVKFPGAKAKKRFLARPITN